MFKKDSGQKSRYVFVSCLKWKKESGKKKPSLFYTSSNLVVQHHHVARVSAQPRVDGLAHAANLVQSRCVMVRPAKLHHLWRTGRQKKKEEKGDVRRQAGSHILISR